MNQQPITKFILSSQNRFAGIAKYPGADSPDPYHTYLALASLALPSPAAVSELQGGHDPLLNASMGTVGWIREKLTAHSQNYGVEVDEESSEFVGETYSSVPGGLGVQGGRGSGAEPVSDPLNHGPEEACVKPISMGCDGVM
jgi:hypothetical protein